MIVLFMVISFIVGCDGQMCQSFLSGCRFFSFFFNHSFWSCRYGFLTFACEKISFSSQMIMEPSISYQA